MGKKYKKKNGMKKYQNFGNKHRPKNKLAGDEKDVTEILQTEHSTTSVELPTVGIVDVNDVDAGDPTSAEPTHASVSNVPDLLGVRTSNKSHLDEELYTSVEPTSVFDENDDCLLKGGFGYEIVESPSNDRDANKIIEFHKELKEYEVLCSRLEYATTWLQNPVPMQNTGFRNYRNSCYENAVLQSLFHLGSFRHWLYSGASMDNHVVSISDFDVQLCNCFTCAIVVVLRESMRKKVPFKACVAERLSNFGSRNEEDAYAFMVELLKAMKECFLNQFVNKEKFDEMTTRNTPIDVFFGSYIRVMLRCLCGENWIRFDHINDMIFDLSKGDSIEELINDYFTEHELNQGTTKCDQCGSDNNIFEKRLFERHPINLIIKIQRVTLKTGKIYKKIPLSKTLSIGKYVVGNEDVYNYNLAAVVIHKDVCGGNGHFTALVKENGSYYLYNDEIIGKYDLDVDDMSGEPYFFIYELNQYHGICHVQKDIEEDLFVQPSIKESKFKVPVFVYDKENFVRAEEYCFEMHGPIEDLHQNFVVPWVTDATHELLVRGKILEKKDIIQCTVSQTRIGDIYGASRCLNSAHVLTPEMVALKRDLGVLHPKHLIGCTSIIKFRLEGNELMYRIPFPLPLFSVNPKIATNVELSIRQKTGAIQSRQGKMSWLFTANIDHIINDAIFSTWNSNWGVVNRQNFLELFK